MSKVKHYAKIVIPGVIWEWLRRTKFRLKFPGERYTCNVCGLRMERFMNGGIDLPVLIEKQVVGGGARGDVHCPRCYCSDRERLLVAYISDNIALENLRVLHVAPEKHLYNFLKNEGAEVVMADLVPENYSRLGKVEKVSLTDIPYSEESYDVVMANHVMEHIADDRIAMSEIYRVLSRGGLAILQVPHSRVIPTTEEDLTVDCEMERERLYGQPDHVRLYELGDYVERLLSVGFAVEVVEPSSLERYSEFAINPSESIVVCRKPSVGR